MGYDVHVTRRHEWSDTDGPQITRDEFLGLKWSKPQKNERAKNVLRYINHFNRLSNWVVREIITKYYSTRAHASNLIT